MVRAYGAFITESAHHHHHPLFLVSLSSSANPFGFILHVFLLSLQQQRKEETVATSHIRWSIFYHIWPHYLTKEWWIPQVTLTWLGKRWLTFFFCTGQEVSTCMDTYLGGSSLFCCVGGVNALVVQQNISAGFYVCFLFLLTCHSVKYIFYFSCARRKRSTFFFNARKVKNPSRS